MGYTILAGNKAPKRPYRDADDNMCYEDMEGPRVSKLVVPDPYTLLEAFTIFTNGGAFWDSWSHEAPAWVEANNDALNMMLKEHYGCEVGAPEDVEETYHTYNGPPGVGPGTVLDQAKDVFENADSNILGDEG